MMAQSPTLGELEVVVEEEEVVVEEEEEKEVKVDQVGSGLVLTLGRGFAAAEREEGAEGEP